MTDLDRFIAHMTDTPADRVPNWELGVWPQTVERWRAEGLDPASVNWDWFAGDPRLGMDRKEFIGFNGGLLPGFEYQVLADEGETEVIRDGLGRTRRALKTGTVHGGRMSMDQYLRFAVETPEDWQTLKRRLDPSTPGRLAANWTDQVERWQRRQIPLVFGPNCTTLGFYWSARDWMGTENLSLAWYDYPAMMHDMMAHWADFQIACVAPVLERTTVEYVCFNEDMACKSGPLLSPQTYRTFIFPHFKRLIEFLKGHGVRWVAVDTDGDSEPLVPLLMEAEVDILWPLERASNQDPARLRRRFGPSLKLWGGVDKRELAKGRAAIDAHLRELAPLVDSGGYVPTVDHTVPPDVSWDDFRYYLEVKQRLLAGRL
jgi:uroporphyrinogen decarboxylase